MKILLVRFIESPKVVFGRRYLSPTLECETCKSKFKLMLNTVEGSCPKCSTYVKKNIESFDYYTNVCLSSPFYALIGFLDSYSEVKVVGTKFDMNQMMTAISKVRQLIPVDVIGPKTVKEFNEKTNKYITAEMFILRKNKHLSKFIINVDNECLLFLLNNLNKIKNNERFINSMKYEMGL